MTKQEWHRLRAYYNAAQASREHRNRISGKRSVKSKAKGVGQVLARSSVKNDARDHLEQARPLTISFPACFDDFRKPVYYKPLSK